MMKNITILYIYTHNDAYIYNYIYIHMGIVKIDMNLFFSPIHQVGCSCSLDIFPVDGRGLSCITAATAG